MNARTRDSKPPPDNDHAAVGNPGLQFRFNPYPPVRPGERVLHFKKWLWGISSKSLPSYRLFFSLPPLWEAGLYVTDQRLLVVSSVLRLFNQDFSIWFSQQVKTPNVDVLKNVSVGRGLFGTYLEINSEAIEPVGWYRSKTLCVRFFTADAELLQRMISEAQLAANK